jgi:hypothetical protein
MPRDANPNLPPPNLLEALRAPRRPRLDDPRACEIFRRWRGFGRPIAFAELKELVNYLTPVPWVSVDRIREVMAAVEAAGFAIHEDDPRLGRLPVAEQLAIGRALAAAFVDCGGIPTTRSAAAGAGRR